MRRFKLMINSIWSMMKIPGQYRKCVFRQNIGGGGGLQVNKFNTKVRPTNNEKQFLKFKNSPNFFDDTVWEKLYFRESWIWCWKIWESAFGAFHWKSLLLDEIAVDFRKLLPFLLMCWCDSPGHQMRWCHQVNTHLMFFPHKITSVKPKLKRWETSTFEINLGEKNILERKWSDVLRDVT